MWFTPKIKPFESHQARIFEELEALGVGYSLEGTGIMIGVPGGAHCHRLTDWAQCPHDSRVKSRMIGLNCAEIMVDEKLFTVLRVKADLRKWRWPTMRATP